MPGPLDYLRNIFQPGDPNEGNPKVQQAVAFHQIMDPSISDVPVKPTNWLQSMIYKGRDAVGGFNPLTGGIRYEPSNMQGMDPHTLLAHEYQHARQSKARGPLGGLLATAKEQFSPYGQGLLESEAFDVENKLYKLRNPQDIELPR